MANRKDRLAGMLLASVLVLGGTVMALAQPPEPPPAPGFHAERLRMVAEQIEQRGISDPAVLGALSRVPRHLFMPAGVRPEAYADSPEPIGYGQTISQPYIVAL